MSQYWIWKSEATDKNGPFDLDPYTVPAIAAPYSDQLFPVACRTGIVNTSYPTLTRGYSFIAKGSFTLANMQIIFGATVKAEDKIRLGIYDKTGNLLGKTEQFTPVAGSIVSKPLISSVAITGGDWYNAAFSIVSTAAGNTYFPAFTYGDTDSATPHVQFADVGNEMPSILGNSIYTANRIWLGWGA